MGQRLVVYLNKDNETIAAIYYHWSAYFGDTIYELGLLSQDILRAEEEGKDALLGIMEGLKQRGGGVRGYGNADYKNDADAAHKLFPHFEFPTKINRNNGLITFTKEGIESFDCWANGVASIDLDTHKIHNYVVLDGEEYGLVYEDQDLGKVGFIRHYEDGTLIKDGVKCPVNAFDFTCESVFELGKFMGII